LLALTAALVFSACGGDRSGADGVSARSDSGSADSAPDPDRLYEVNATVLEDRSHGPMLCLGGVLTSLPPQCGDVPIANWDWRRVEGEEAEGGTIWGSYHVVGTYDGQTFTLTEVRPSGRNPSVAGTDPDVSSPCRAPKGGWTELDHATQGDVHPADAYAQSQSDYVTSWITHLDPSALEFGPVIFNAVFTDDAEEHEAEIGKVWSGPLCVVARDVPSARELRQIRREAEAGLEELGLRMLWSQGPSVPGVQPVIEIGVVVDGGGNGQAALDARYGPGVVRLVPALTPAS
jgi:hypothetical protein